MYLFKRGINFASVLQVKKQLLTATNCKSIIESSATNYKEFSKNSVDISVDILACKEIYLPIKSGLAYITVTIGIQPRNETTFIDLSK